MASAVAEIVVATLRASGIRRVYGIPGDSLNGFTDALRRDGGIAWQHVRHEEAAAFAGGRGGSAQNESCAPSAWCGASFGIGTPHRQESTMPLTTPRYDGYAEWYDNWNKPHAERNAADVQDLLGPGAGLCLDLGCGSGLYFGVLAAAGRTVVGLDRSADQLRIAHGRSRQIVLGDAAALPFADGTFPAVATLWLSTDVDDFAAVLREVARVLKPGGLVACYGAHPCFNGPHTQWLDDGGIVAHPTYRLAGWHQEAPWWGPYVRRRVGMRHHPLAELLNGFIGAGLAIEYVAELGDRPIPVVLAIRARKPKALPPERVS